MISLFANDGTVEPLLDEVIERQAAVMRSGRYILGPEVEAFEAEFAAAMGTSHCVGVANGTDAITVGLRALGVGPGDEVIVPSITFFATPEAVVNAGARPVFCDVDPETDCMTAELVEPLITSRTRAIIPVHIFGNPAPMAELQALATDREIGVLGDAAQAAGATLDGKPAAAHGDLSTFSFYPSKNLGGFGDGGAVVTDSDELADRLRRIRFHGTLAKGFHEQIGFNSRLDELQAVGLRVLLPHLEDWNERRRAGVAAYRAAGLGDHVELPVETAGAESAYHLFVVRSDDREALSAQLKERGVASRAYYTTPMHRQPALAEYAPKGALVNSDRFAERNLALPVGPGLSEDAVQQVVGAVAEARAATVS